MNQPDSLPENDLAAFFLAQGEQSGKSVARLLANFIGGAKQSLDIAVYDMRLNNSLKANFSEALRGTVQRRGIHPYRL